MDANLKKLYAAFLLFFHPSYKKSKVNYLKCERVRSDFIFFWHTFVTGRYTLSGNQ